MVNPSGAPLYCVSVRLHPAPSEKLIPPPTPYPTTALFRNGPAQSDNILSVVNWVGREVNPVKIRKITAARKPGYYGDGGGLYLQVSKFGSKSWIFRFMLDGRARDMGLGLILTSL